MIRSISLYRSALKDSIEICFIFFWVVLYFLCIFEVYMNFWKYKRKWKLKTLGAQCWAALWPMASGLQLGPMAQRPGWHGTLTHTVTARSAIVVAWPVRAGRRTRCDEGGGVSMRWRQRACLTRSGWRKLTRAVGRQQVGRKAVAHRRSKVAVGSIGRGGRQWGPTTGGGDRGGERPPDRGERSARVELTVEGGNDSSGGLKCGNLWGVFGDGRW
jgi:hypothetical protein